MPRAKKKAKVTTTTNKVEPGIKEIIRSDGTLYYTAKFTSMGEYYDEEFYYSYRYKLIDVGAKEKARSYQQRIKDRDREMEEYDYKLEPHMRYDIGVGAVAYSSFHRKADTVKEIFWYGEHGVKNTVYHIQDADPFANILIAFKSLGTVGISHVQENKNV